MAQNQAAVLIEAGQPLVIRDTEFPQPGPNEIVIKNAAVAINPIDVAQQKTGLFLKKYPVVLGHDLAGEVHSIGSAVTRFKPGDRITGHGWAMNTGDLQDGTFQLYTKIHEANAAILPAHISFVDGAVLPLAIDTAATGLYLPKPHIGLPWPKTDSKTASGTIIVYGGSSSVGAVAIQLAAANGSRVLAIASTHNHDLCKRSGASEVFDYRDPSLVEKIVAAVGKDHFHGILDAISEPSTYKHDQEILERLPGGSLSSTHILPDFLASDPRAKMIFGLGEHTFPVWERFIGDALANGQLQCLPKPLVVGKGLSHAQGAIDRLAAGVSGQKVVFEL